MIRDIVASGIAADQSKHAAEWLEEEKGALSGDASERHAFESSRPCSVSAGSAGRVVSVGVERSRW